MGLAPVDPVTRWGFLYSPFPVFRSPFVVFYFSILPEAS